MSMADPGRVEPAIQIPIATVAIAHLSLHQHMKLQMQLFRVADNKVPTRSVLAFGKAFVPSLILMFGIAGVTLRTVRADAQTTMQSTSPPPPAESGMEMEVPHPFFTHEGLPDPVGGFSLRTGILATRVDGKTQTDVAFHLETGLTDHIGLHIRNDRVLNTTRTEAMFQFVAFRNKSGTSGFAPIIEFEFPTRSGEPHRVSALVGETSKISNARVAFNQVVHYDPREDGVDWSASLVGAVTPWLFPVIETLGMAGSGKTAGLNLLAGLKVRVREGFLLGFAYQFPVTKNKDFSSQFVFQPDVDWKINR